jgi:hypothetical protein
MVELSPVDVVRELWERVEREGVQAALGRVDDDVVYLLQMGAGRVIHGTGEVRSVLAAMESRGEPRHGRGLRGRGRGQRHRADPRPGG